ncbi:MAG TPA: hypothetical protein VGM77_01630 [Gemmatimonadales bacterium]|jgi:hypothetical protein
MKSLLRRCLLLIAAILMAVPRCAVAQTTRTLAVESDLVKDPSGIPLLHLARGTAVSVGPAKNGWMTATIQGWIAENALHDDKRDGFDVSVSLSAGTTLRSAPNGTPLATARLGALFDKIDTRNGWVHVKRTGWLSQVAFTAPTPPPAASKAVVTPPPAKTAAPPAAATTVAAGAALAAQPNGTTIGTLESPAHADVVEHRGGWAHLRLDVWVRDNTVGTAPSPGEITAADLRANPDKYVGQTVEWTVEVIGLEKADELRPEMPMGQPYLLARGPLPESGFLYIAVSKEEADSFSTIEPLARIHLRATIRAGRSKFLPTPVLNFVRLLN